MTLVWATRTGTVVISRGDRGDCGNAVEIGAHASSQTVTYGAWREGCDDRGGDWKTSEGANGVGWSYPGCYVLIESEVRICDSSEPLRNEYCQCPISSGLRMLLVERSRQRRNEKFKTQEPKCTLESPRGIPLCYLVADELHFRNNLTTRLLCLSRAHEIAGNSPEFMKHCPVVVLFIVNRRSQRSCYMLCSEQWIDGGKEIQHSSIYVRWSQQGGAILCRRV